MNLKQLYKHRLILIVTFGLVFLISCNSNHRFKIIDYKLGESIEQNRYEILEDNYKLSFPDKEVRLKSDTSVIMQIVGDDNQIYSIEKNNISNEDIISLVDSISNYLNVKPLFENHYIVQQFWICDLYQWTDSTYNDIIRLERCIHYCDSIAFLNKKDWTLSIYNHDLFLKLINQYPDN